MGYCNHNAHSGRRSAQSRCSVVQAAAQPWFESLERRTLFSIPVAGGVPLLSSNPAATAKLYLDFDGDKAAAWNTYSVPSTPAYDVDGDVTAFNDAELANIRQIWARVAEKFSPFNLDVTTVDPGAFADKLALHVVIGGNSSWTGYMIGTLADRTGFSTGSQNTVYVFEDQFSPDNLKVLSENTAQASAKAFGLNPQKVYDGVISLGDNKGDELKAPIMGYSGFSERGLWWYGPYNKTTYGIAMQDDMAVLADLTTNGFGYRVDDRGNTFTSATALTASGGGGGGGTLSGSGVVEQTTDSDCFSFTTTGGQVTVNANVASYGAMLDLKLQLFNSAGQPIASSDSSTLGESLSSTLAAGTYYLVVASHGSYGDVGQYTLSVTAPTTIVPAPSAPSNLTASAISSSEINLTWSDNSGNESGFAIDRATDSGFTQNFSTNSVGANVTSYSATALAASTTYYFRVRATSAAGNSANSNVVSATTASTLPAAPANLIGSAISSSQINLSWADRSSNESGFVLDRATDAFFTQNVSTANVGSNATSYSATALSASTTYYFRVRATNAAGSSGNSNTAIVRTAATLPTTPSSLTALAVSAGQINLSWLDNSGNETGFLVDRATDIFFTQNLSPELLRLRVGRFDHVLLPRAGHEPGGQFLQLQHRRRYHASDIGYHGPHRILLVAIEWRNGHD
jgi:hypothetical protein